MESRCFNASTTILAAMTEEAAVNNLCILNSTESGKAERNI